MEDDIEEEIDEDDNYYAPLTCDLCQETFKTPALWVRHVETHPTNDLPQRKRRKVSCVNLCTSITSTALHNKTNEWLRGRAD
jgi:hypothetical protein